MRTRFAAILQNTIMIVLVSGSAAIIAASLYSKAQPVDMTQFINVTGSLRQLKELDTRWNEDILKSRLSINSNYDPVTNPLLVLADLEQGLESTFSRRNTGNDELLNSLNQYKTVVEEKIELVERFKSQNAILRNSLRFIPTAVRNLLAAIDKAKQASGAPIAQLTDLETQSNALLQGLLEYNLLPQDNVVTFLEQASNSLERDKNVYPESVNQHLSIALSHARTVLRQKPAVEDLIANIISVPTVTQLDALQQSYSLLYEQRRASAEQFRLIFIVYMSVIALLIAALFLRVRSKARLRMLQRMNRGLEQRVAVRTQELETAYEELKESQFRLIQSEKMSSLGQMVAGVAHEINTPLAYSRGNLDVIIELLPDLEALVQQAAELSASGNTLADLSKLTALTHTVQDGEILPEIQNLIGASASGLDQISEMVQNLKNFSRLDRKKVDDVNLNESLDSALMIAQNQLKHKADVIKHYAEIPTIKCMPSQLNQVFLNLLVNAAQAIEEHGSITLTTALRGDAVEVSIEDTGNGIPEDALPKIFDPFFTTKAIGQGTGLGLSIVYKIIEQHGGSIKVDSTIGKGTRFTVTLPMSDVTEVRQAA